MKIILATAIPLVIFITVVCFFAAPFWVFTYQTAQGEHTGYVTAVEKTGIFFKTGTAYVKTNTTSSQEDAYCVMDDAVYVQLQGYAASQQQVDIYFKDWLKKGITNCAGEDDFIYKVIPINSSSQESK